MDIGEYPESNVKTLPVWHKAPSGPNASPLFFSPQPPLPSLPLLFQCTCHVCRLLLPSFAPTCLPMPWPNQRSSPCLATPCDEQSTSSGRSTLSCSPRPSRSRRPRSTPTCATATSKTAWRPSTDSTRTSTVSKTVRRSPSLNPRDYIFRKIGRGERDGIG